MFKEVLETIIERTEGSLGALIMGIDGIAVERLLKDAGQEIMSIWNDMDRGTLKQDEAFEEADKAARRRSAEKDM